MSRGCVAAGNERTVEAGLYAFKKGGNAVDALIASQLAATVVEPLLTGMGGAGIAVIKSKDKYKSVDMFTAMPGLDGRCVFKPRMDEVSINFGPTTQAFNIGLGSVAVPSLAKGLVHLHRSYALLPMSTLAAPAIDYATKGFLVSPHFEKVVELLWPICNSSNEMRALFSGKNGRIRAGESFNPAGMAEDLREFVALGPDFLIKGRLGEALNAMSEKNKEMMLGVKDIESYQVHVSNMRKTRFKSSFVHTPIAPSVGGALIDATLSVMNDLDFPKNPYGMETMQSLIDVQRVVEEIRSDRGFIQKIVEESNNPLNFNGFNENPVGSTTHISVVDRDGCAAGITTSLGESCGVVISGSQLILNNFLGEADVSPIEATDKAGGRLVTMCSPSMMENSKGIYVLGSGGSSRIPTAVLHGIMYLEVYGKSLPEAVPAPRLHSENATINVESDGRDVSELNRLKNMYGDAVNVFNGPNMYFGGLHAVGLEAGRFVGFGDDRRSGASGCQ